MTFDTQNRPKGHDHYDFNATYSVNRNLGILAWDIISGCIAERTWLPRLFFLGLWLSLLFLISPCNNVFIHRSIYLSLLLQIDSRKIFYPIRQFYSKRFTHCLLICYFAFICFFFRSFFVISSITLPYVIVTHDRNSS